MVNHLHHHRPLPTRSDDGTGASAEAHGASTTTASTKSTCQLRLEARSAQYAAQRQQRQHKLAAAASQRLARAAAARQRAERQRITRARARVAHARRVAAETHARRREHVVRSRRRTGERLEIARHRRQEALSRLAQGCRERVANVLERVESVREIQRLREARQRQVLDRQLQEAARRRAAQTARMRARLESRWRSVATVKDRVQRAKATLQRGVRRWIAVRRTAVAMNPHAADVARLVAGWRELERLSFEDSMRRLQERSLAHAAQTVLRVLVGGSSSSNASGPKPSSPPRPNMSPRASTPFRVLLMVGMLAAHPKEIMAEDHCPLLAFAAHGVVRAMARLHAQLDPATATTTRDLGVALIELEGRFEFYFECFSAWKDRDAERLAVEMLGTYHEIYRTLVRYRRERVHHAGDGMHELRHQTQRQLTQLAGALAQVIGRDEAHERITSIESRVDADEESAGSGSDDGEGSSDSSTERSSCAAHASDQEMEEREAEPSPSKPQTKATPKRTSGAVHVALDRPAAHASTTSMPPPPPAQVSSLLSDSKLVHELILNPAFRLPTPSTMKHSDDGAESLTVRVRQNMVRAYWDQLVAANDETALLKQFEELREQFTKIMNGRGDLVQAVHVALNSEALGALLSEPSIAAYQEIRGRCVRVLQAIRLTEAPARNESTDLFLRELDAKFAAMIGGSGHLSSPVRILVDVLAFSMEKMEEIQVDVANVHIGMLATYLTRHGTDYEQHKFEAHLAANPAAYVETDKWLAGELESQWERLAPTERKRLQDGDAGAFSLVLRSSMMTLIFKHIGGGAGAVWPETFALDLDRIRGFRDAMDRIALVATMLVVVQDSVTRTSGLTAPRDFFKRLAAELSDLLQSPGVSGSHLVAQAIKALQVIRRLSGLTPLASEALHAMESRFQSAFQAGDPVFGLLSSRVAASVESLALKDQGEFALHPSLAPFEAELRPLATAVRKLFKHNETVHASLYNGLIKKKLRLLHGGASS